MLERKKKGDSTAPDERLRFAPVGKRGGGGYHRLYDYLKNRYTDTVVLTFQQVEEYSWGSPCRTWPGGMPTGGASPT